jgi:hypothetical protein
VNLAHAKLVVVHCSSAGWGLMITRSAIGIAERAEESEHILSCHTQTAPWGGGPVGRTLGQALGRRAAPGHPISTAAPSLRGLSQTS